MVVISSVFNAPLKAQQHQANKRFSEPQGALQKNATPATAADKEAPGASRLSTTQLNNLSVQKLNKLAPVQLNKLNVKALSKLNNAQLAKLNAAQLAKLPDAKLKRLNPQILKKLSLAKRNQLDLDKDNKPTVEKTNSSQAKESKKVVKTENLSSTEKIAKTANKPIAIEGVKVTISSQARLRKQ